MKSLLLIPALAAAFGLSGCVVTPPTVRPAYVAQPAYVAPPGVVYVQPTYASPGPGWVWEYHSYYGWGWHHARSCSWRSLRPAAALFGHDAPRRCSKMPTNHTG